jgi:hypothetical protein
MGSEGKQIEVGCRSRTQELWADHVPDFQDFQILPGTWNSLGTGNIAG